MNCSTATSTGAIPLVLNLTLISSKFYMNAKDEIIADITKCSNTYPNANVSGVTDYTRRLEKHGDLSKSRSTSCVFWLARQCFGDVGFDSGRRIGRMPVCLYWLRWHCFLFSCYCLWKMPGWNREEKLITRKMCDEVYIWRPRQDSWNTWAFYLMLRINILAYKISRGLWDCSVASRKISA